MQETPLVLLKYEFLNDFSHFDSFQVGGKSQNLNSSKQLHSRNVQVFKNDAMRIGFNALLHKLYTLADADIFP